VVVPISLLFFVLHFSQFLFWDCFIAALGYVFPRSLREMGEREIEREREERERERERKRERDRERGGEEHFYA
jgi:hypothetical protein